MIIETENAYHFYIGKDEYLGMLTYEGQLSDFMANIINNKILFNNKSREEPLKTIKKCINALLNIYIAEQARHVISDPLKFKVNHVNEFTKQFKELKNVHRLSSKEQSD